MKTFSRNTSILVRHFVFRNAGYKTEQLPIGKILSTGRKRNKMLSNAENVNIAHIAYSAENQCQLFVFKINGSH